MSAGTNKLLKITMRPETDFGDTKDLSGDVSDGVLLRPLEDIPLDQFVKEAIGDTTVRQSFSDAGLPAVEGLSTAVIPISLRMTGNTRNVGVLTEDGTSKVLDWTTGTRITCGDDAAEALSTDSNIVATGHSYTANDVVMINGEAALVTTVDTNNFDITPPLSAAPGATDVITGMESFLIDTDAVPGTVGLGVTREGDAEWQWTGHAGLCTKIELGEIAPGAQPVINLEISLADHKQETVTHSETEIPSTTQVIGAVGAKGLRMTDASGAFLGPDLSRAQIGMGFEATFAEGLNTDGVGGKVKPVLHPMDGEVGTILVLQDPDETTFADLTALIGETFSLIIQVNSELGKTFGIIYPEATFTKFPTPAATGNNVKAVEFGFKAGVGVLFRG